MPGTNLTRDEAAQRAQLLDVGAYDVTLDLTTGDKTFRTTTVVRFTARTPGASTFVDLIADAVHEVVLNGRSLPVHEVVSTGRIALDDLAARERAARRRRRHLHAHRRGPAPVRRPGRRRGLPLQPVRGGRRAPGVRVLRPARPQGAFAFTVTAPGHWTVSVRLPDARTGAGDRRDRHLAVRADADAVAVRHGDRRRAVPRRARGAHQPRRPHHPARRLLPALARASTSTPTTSSAVTQAGLRLLRGAVRPPVPVREVRPAVRAGVQRRRDGERRRRDHHRALRVPVQGPRGDRRAPRAHDPARARPHVVRRPRHHALVGRPVAERVVRRVRVHAVPGRGHPVARRPGPRSRSSEKAWAYRQDQLATDAPDRRRHPRPRGRRGQLRRHHLRQGRLGAQAAGALGRAGGVRRRACGATSGAHAWGNTTLRDLLRRAGGDERARPRHLGAAVAAAGRGEHAAPRSPGRRRRRDHRARRRPGGARRPPGAAPAPPRRRRVRPRRRQAAPHAPRRARRRGGPHGGAGSRRACRARTCCWSTTTTWPTPRSGWTRASLATAVGHLRDFDDALPRSLVLARRVGHDPRRRAGRPLVRRSGARHRRLRRRPERRAARCCGSSPAR